MTTHTCKHCAETKPAEAMCQRGGKPSTICRDCFSAKLSKGPRKSKAPKTLAEVVERRTKKREPAPVPVVIEDSLEILPARGCRASVENGFVVIEQDDELDGGAIHTHNITLTLSEFDRIADLRQRIGAST